MIQQPHSDKVEQNLTCLHVICCVSTFKEPTRKWSLRLRCTEHNAVLPDLAELPTPVTYPVLSPHTEDKEDTVDSVHPSVQVQ
jgi:hypothetical protein